MALKANRAARGGVEQLFSVLLFFLFLFCALFTILIGSRVYENIRARNNASFQTDTALAYITNKVRQGDRADAVHVREEEGRSVLVLTSFFNDTEYETKIYCLDGKLYELFSQRDSGIGLSFGQEIMECSSVSFAMESRGDNSSVLTVSMEGGADISLLLRSDAEAGGNSSAKGGTN